MTDILIEPNDSLPNDTTSPAESSISLSPDAINTTAARLHWGPLGSPEKKYMPLVDIEVTPRAISPPHSTGSSMPAVELLSQNVPDHEECDDSRGIGDDEDAMWINNSRVRTPEFEFLPQDDPSSVLASRVIRAHSNPSPPPSPSVHIIGSPTSDPLTLPFNQSSHCLPHSTHGNYGQSNTGLIELSDAEPILGQSAPPLDNVEPPLIFDTSEHDLITFDSFNNSSAIQLPLQLEPQNLPEDSHSVNYASSVDDLLSQSPLRSAPQHSAQPPALVSGGNVSHLDDSGTEANNKEEMTSETTDDERLVADALSHGEAEVESSSTESTESTPPPAIVLPVPDDIEPDSPPRTPLRRSTRPRRSGTPYALQLSVSLEASDFAGSQTTPLNSFLVPSSATQTQKKRWKGKEKRVYLSDEIVSDSQSGGRRSPRRSISAGIEGSVSGDDSTNRFDEWSVEDAKEREDRRKERERKGKEVFQRELGSLSPRSANLLTQLVPSGKSSPILEFDVDLPADSPQPQPQVDPTTPQRPAFSFTVFRQQEPSFVSQKGPAVETQSDYRGPVRFASPVRFSGPGSPSKLQQGAYNALNRSPARRIPMERAPSQVQLSARKFSKLGVRAQVNAGPSGAAGGGSMRTPVFTVPPTDTPAKRVNVHDGPSSPGKLRPQSPVRSIPRERSGFAESRPTGVLVGKGKSRSVSADPQHPQSTPHPGKDVVFEIPQSAASSSSLAVLKPSTLPFPLVAPTERNHLPKSIPEETGNDVSVDSPEVSPKTKPVPTPSPLKSSLKQPTSRIPRIGRKPYARPLTTTSALEMKKALRSPPTVRKLDLSTVAKVGKQPKPLRLVRNDGRSEAHADVTTTKSASSATSTGSGTAVTLVNLKRKRGEKGPLPEKPRPMVTMRQVITPTSHLSSPAKQHLGSIHLRRVVDRDIELHHDLVSETKENFSDMPISPTAEKPNHEDMAGPSKSHIPDVIVTPPPSPPPISNSPSVSSPPSRNEAREHGQVRRTTRVRKPVQVVDVFGSTAQPRRKPRSHLLTRSDAGTFSGMSAIALKALTTTNTARNQKYVAAKLETEIIRKDGARPDSPTIKVKTISQKEKEEMGRQRRERAERRARRSEDGESYDEQSDGNSSMVCGDGWDSENCDGSPHPAKHRKGAGDEEDHETPDKVERPAKKFRVGVGEADGRQEEKRRVKWDQGLSTTIYLDEVQVRGHARSNRDAIKKGCLAKTAKALQLDTLGNHPNADSPLTDLVPENVVVKKFVYDNDLQPDQIIVRSTRSKGRKAKS